MSSEVVSKLSQELPTVSILLSTFNSEEFLEVWFNSIIKQSIWTECELIIVANEPKGTELKLSQAFANKYSDQVKLLIVPRENLYASWNRALQVSQGKYLAIANIDDLRTSNSLESQVNTLESNPYALFTYGSFQIVRAFGKTNGVDISPPAFDKQEFTRSMYLGPFFVWRRTKNPSVQYFDEQFRSGGDFDFAIRLALSGKGVRVKDNHDLGYYYNACTGLSTGSILQPVERTVIELRYGIYDKIDYRYLPHALKYNIYQLLQENQWIPVEDFVSNYAEMISDRYKLWFDRGLKNHLNLMKREKNPIRQGLRMIKSIKIVRHFINCIKPLVKWQRIKQL